MLTKQENKRGTKRSKCRWKEFSPLPVVFLWERQGGLASRVCVFQSQLVWWLRILLTNSQTHERPLGIFTVVCLCQPFSSWASPCPSELAWLPCTSNSAYFMQGKQPIFFWVSTFVRWRYMDCPIIPGSILGLLWGWSCLCSVLSNVWTLLFHIFCLVFQWY